MREIKFRGKRLDNGEWAYGSLSMSGGSHPNYNHNRTFIEPFQEVLERIEVDPSTVGQFTEKIDKKLKKIWEGDIIKECFEGKEIWDGDGIVKECPIGVVEWQDYFFNVRPIKKGLVDLKNGEQSELNISRYDGEFQWGYVEIEIVGTIHDNPELLEEKK